MKHQSFSLIKEWNDHTAKRRRGYQRSGYKMFVIKMGMGLVGVPFFVFVSLASSIPFWLLMNINAITVIVNVSFVCLPNFTFAALRS